MLRLTFLRMRDKCTFSNLQRKYACLHVYMCVHVLMYVPTCLEDPKLPKDECDEETALCGMNVMCDRCTRDPNAKSICIAGNYHTSLFVYFLFIRFESQLLSEIKLTH